MALTVVARRLNPAQARGSGTMGLFRRAGRKVERLKRSVEAVADEEATHACTDCGERFYADREACEECGGPVEPLA